MDDAGSKVRTGAADTKVKLSKIWGHLAGANAIRNRRGLAGIAVVATGGGVLDWACRTHPAQMPFWAPWDFSWPEYLVTALTLWFYGAGLARMPVYARPSSGARCAFLAGVFFSYAVLQTRFDFMAQHMFTLTRVQHLMTHHIGPFLIALSHPRAVLDYGMPAWLRRAIGHPGVRRFIAIFQQPVIAGVLFVGLIFFWLIPGVLFRAMLDHRLYAVMNWSMVLDGLLFWCLVLDKRPMPPARLSRGMRLLLVFAVQWPQIAGGAMIGMSERVLYPYYALCGRLFPAVSNQADQQIGGFLIWFGGGMMSAIAVLILLRALWTEEERKARATIPGWDASSSAPGRSLPSS